MNMIDPLLKNYAYRRSEFWKRKIFEVEPCGLSDYDLNCLGKQVCEGFGLKQYEVISSPVNCGFGGNNTSWPFSPAQYNKNLFDFIQQFWRREVRVWDNLVYVPDGDADDDNDFGLRQMWTYGIMSKMCGHMLSVIIDYDTNSIDTVNKKDLDKNLSLAKLASLSGAFWVVNGELLVIQKKPIKIVFGENGVVHNASGPAITYKSSRERIYYDYGDKWNDEHFEPTFEIQTTDDLYVWRGIGIKRNWIEKEPEVHEAILHRNAERRRVACEILGWDRVIKELGSTVIDENTNPQIGTLVEVRDNSNNFFRESRERFLRVKCGTGRWFAIPVPPSINTAIEANAWTYDIDVELLKELEIRT